MSLPEGLTKDLKSALPKASWTTDADRIAPHLTEWRDRWQGQAAFMVLPGSTDEVAKIVQACSGHGVPMVAQGGNTGLVGAGMPGGDELLISFKRMAAIREVDPVDGSVVAEAGVPLAQVQRAAREAGLQFPLSLASEGSCTVGGIIATNAGGVHVLRYGMTRAMVLGVEAVMAGGALFDDLSGVRKDNSGPDIKQLLVGSEGTLGLVTAARLKLVQATPHRAVAMVALDNPHHALSVLRRLRASAGPVLDAVELMPRFGLEILRDHQNLPALFKPLPEWVLLVELASNKDQSLDDALGEILCDAVEQDEAQGALIAQSMAQQQQFWSYRHLLSETQKQVGASLKHDIAVPVARLADFLDQALPLVSQIVPGIRPCPFGHLGDGNLHFNLSQPQAMGRDEFLSHRDAVARAVHDLVAKFGGSIAAEHGIGIQKREDHARLANPAKLAAQKAIKSALDPQNLFAPGRILLP